jgi:hypothetical protein
MFRIHAVWIVAEMIDVKALGNFALVDAVRDTVGRMILLLALAYGDFEATIAGHLVRMKRPINAVIGFREGSYEIH